MGHKCAKSFMDREKEKRLVEEAVEVRRCIRLAG